MQVLVGCDPELFVKKDGIFRSAWNLITGTKTDPTPVQQGAVQVDGMALEFNTDPAASEDEFLSNITVVMRQLEAMVPDYEIVKTPVAHFDKEYFDLQPLESKILGCDPDFNAYTMEANSPPDNKRPMRTASGHVHIGFEVNEARDGPHFNIAVAVCRQMDFYLGLPSLVYDKDTERREMYGKAGAFRMKPYGMEYRVLSNAWLTDDRLIRWVFRASQKAVTDMFEKDRYLPQMCPADVQDIINNSRVEEALAICREYGIEVPNEV